MIPHCTEMPVFAGLASDIRGRIGCRVYYMRGNRICSRRHVIPINPRTRRQQNGRKRFADIVKRWQALDNAARKRWNERANGMDMSGYNLFVSTMMKGGHGRAILVSPWRRKRWIPRFVIESTQITFTARMKNPRFYIRV